MTCKACGRPLKVGVMVAGKRLTKAVCAHPICKRFGKS